MFIIEDKVVIKMILSQTRKRVDSSMCRVLLASRAELKNVAGTLQMDATSVHRLATAAIVASYKYHPILRFIFVSLGFLIKRQTFPSAIQPPIVFSARSIQFPS